VAIGIAVPVRGARANFRVRGHVDELAGRGSVCLIEGFYLFKYDLYLEKVESANPPEAEQRAPANGW
jgi:hypothetical protein